MPQRDIDSILLWISNQKILDFMRKIGCILMVCVLVSCNPAKKYHRITGETMGTYYLLTYEGDSPQKVKEEVGQILKEFNNSLSTYIPTSLISQLNKSEKGVSLPSNDPYFEPVWNRAKELKTLTKGALNTSIMPLLRYWRDNNTAIDTSTVMTLSDLVQSSDFEIVNTDEGRFIMKSLSEAELDFSSLAKGYGIDVLAMYFKEQGIENYLVDIGGEARAEGVNNQGSPWTLAINKPIEGSGLSEAELLVQLVDKSIATSGTYRQFYEKDGKRIAHIMNPVTGYSTTSDLLSASIIAEDCMTADGLATALMVNNFEGAKAFLELNNYPACLIYDADGKEPLEKYFANGFDQWVVSIN